jgi:hypothetical protein
MMPTMIRELVEQDVNITLDLSDQVLDVDAPDDGQFGEPSLSPVPVASTSLVSASVLAQKAKQFDDALYAAVELAVQRGLGAMPSKWEFLRAWAKVALDAREHGQAACLLFGACELGRAGLQLPEDVSAAVKVVVEDFLADERRSAPLGFYTQTAQLAAIFRQDRLLMTELREPLSSADALAGLASRDEHLLRTYQRILTLASKMTNPASADLHDLLQTNARSGRRILLPSRSHEGELVLRLFGDRPIPDGFDLADELANRVKAGSLSLAPNQNSGWYDHQTWALEPLVAPLRAPESTRVRHSDRYRHHLRQLFKGLLALTRETHVKQLEMVLAGAAGRHDPATIFIRPELTGEPLPTYYARRAQSYRFIRTVLEETFGPAWQDLPFTEVPTAYERVDEGLDGMEALFHGAHVRLCRDLGMESDPTVMPDRNPDADGVAFESWAARMTTDPDLSRDTRMMVPVFYDLQRRKVKVWALLGWSDRPVTIDFLQTPRIVEAVPEKQASRLQQLRRRFGKAQENAAPQIEFVAAYHRVAFPVTAEVYVNQLLNRDAFQRLCDERKTPTAILEALRTTGG